MSDDTTCLMQPFSYTSPQLSTQSSQENENIYGMIEESVSFGRYTEENMSWEKWSKSRNRYVEEAVKYSKPGSVAEKKAFFEEYFRRLAALKAKALLDQANAEQSIRVGEESENVGIVGFVVHHNELYSEGGEDEEPEGNDDVGIDSVMQVRIGARNEMNTVAESSCWNEMNAVVAVTGESSCRNEMNAVSVTGESSCRNEMNAVSVTGESSCRNEMNAVSVPGESSCRNLMNAVSVTGESSCRNDMNAVVAVTGESRCWNEMNAVVAVTGESSCRNEMNAVSVTGESSCRNDMNAVSVTGESSCRNLMNAVSVTGESSCRNEMNAVSVTGESSCRNEMNAVSVTGESSCRNLMNAVVAVTGESRCWNEMNAVVAVTGESSCSNEMNAVAVTGESSCWNEEGSSGIMQTNKVPLQAMFDEEDSATIMKRNPPLSSYMLSIRSVGRTRVLASSPSKSVAAVYPGKENYATPMKPKPLINDPDKKIRTPLRASINREFNKILSPVMRKIGTSSKSSTPSNTHAKDTWRDRTEPSPMTPNLTKRGPRNRNDPSTCDSKVPRPRWNILTTEGFRSPNIGRNKISSPIIPTSFCLKTGERAARRKQKLEEKFNATTMEKAPQASKLKMQEKAEAEVNKIRQTFCFKTISSPDEDHYGEHETSKDPKHKNDPTHIASPWQSRQLHSSTYESTSSLPPRRPTSKQVFMNRMHLSNTRN